MKLNSNTVQKKYMFALPFSKAILRSTLPYLYPHFLFFLVLEDGRTGFGTD